MRVPLWAKIATTTVTAACLMALALFFGVERVMDGQWQSRILEQQRGNLRIAADALTHATDGVTLRFGAEHNVNRITFDQWPEFAGAQNPSHDMIDGIGRLTGETATLFAYVPEERDFIRRTTNIIKPNGERAVGTLLGSGSAAYPPMMDGEPYLGRATILGTDYMTLYQPVFAGSPDVPANANGVAGILYVGVSATELAAATAEFRRQFAVIALFIVGLTATGVALWSYYAMRPLTKVARQIQALADEQPVQVQITHKDVIGDIQAALGKLADSAQQAFAQAQMLSQSDSAVMAAEPDKDGVMRVSYANRAAIALLHPGAHDKTDGASPLVGEAIGDLFPEASAGDPTDQFIVKRGEETVAVSTGPLTGRDGGVIGATYQLSSLTSQEQVADSFRRQVTSILSDVQSELDQLTDRTGMLTDTAERGVANSNELTNAAGVAADAVGNVADALDDLNRSFAEVAEQVGQNGRMAENASAMTAEAVTAAQDLDAASRRIRNAITFINTIAEQTNLLALNATIEASRAGEAGKGFAVVASEVKTLADRAGTAAREIAGEVDSITGISDRLVNAFDEVQSAIGSVNDTSGAVSATVAGQQSAADRISQSVSDVTETSGNVTILAQTVSEQASQTGDAAEAVRSITQELTDASETLGKGAAQFLEEMRRAA